MKFLYPEFLFGLFSLAIPIIVHLFNFRKSKNIYFSGTQFLESIKKKTGQRRNIKHLLILFTRLLFLTFVVLAFAQPYLPSVDKNPPSESVYIYLDNSNSMSNKAENGASGLDLGVDYVNKLLDLYPENTNYKLLTNDFAPFSNTLKSSGEVEELLTEIKYSTVSRTLNEAYDRLTGNTLNQSDRNKDIYIISDFQKSTMGNPEQLDIDSADRVYVAPILFDAVQNIFIDSVYLSNPYLVADEKNQLNVIIRNSGLEDAEELPIRLFINEIQTAATVVSIPAQSTAELTFEMSYNLESVNRCRISFEDYPITFDNDFYFVLKQENKINIMEIRANEERTPIELVFGNPALFNFESQLASNVNYSYIKQVDLVIADGLQSIDNSLTEALNDFVRNGGTLCIIPNEKPDLESYQKLIPAALTEAADSVAVKFAEPDLSDPFFENIFESDKEQIDLPQALPVLNWRGRPNDLLKLRNELSFMSYFKNTGIVFILASPLADEFTNFQRHALFVPVMYRMAAMSRKSYEKPYYEINEPTIYLRLDSLKKQDIFALTNQESELIPNQRINTNELILEMPKNTITPGFYNLQHDNKTDAVLAFNLEKAESFPDRLTPEELQNIFSSLKNVTVFDTNDADIFSNEVKKNKFGVPLWKYAIILSLIFLLAEVLLIRLL